MERKSGYYTVTYEGEEVIAFYDSDTDLWALDGRTYDDERFDDIDENIVTNFYDEQLP